MHQECWALFAPFHYLDARINKAARAFVVTWAGRVVAFESRLPFPGRGRKDTFREHRLVVLPDFQGLGVGPRVSEAFGWMHMRQGLRFCSRTAHPRLGAYRTCSPPVTDFAEHFSRIGAQSGVAQTRTGTLGSFRPDLSALCSWSSCD